MRMVVAESARTRRSPISEAARIRGDIIHALHDETWYSQTVSPEVAACMLGISADALNNPHMAILFQPTKDGFEIAAGTTRQTAMEAFRNWSTAPDKRSKNTFARDCYMTLYPVWQGAQSAAGDGVLAEVAEFFVTAMAEDDPSWEPFLARVRGHGDIAGEEDMRLVAGKMDELWRKIPPGMRSSLASYSPDHLFNT